MNLKGKYLALTIAIVFILTTILPASIETPANSSKALALDPISLTVQNGLNGYNGSIDVSNLKEYPNDHGSSWMGYFSNGKSGSMRIQDDGGFGNNGLISFDLSQIPGNSTIVSAQLKLYQYWGSQSNGNIDLFRITDPNNKGMWVEGQLQFERDDCYNSSGAAYLKRAGGFDRAYDATYWTNIEGSTVMDAVVNDNGNPVASGSIDLTNANKAAGWVASSDVTADIQKWVSGSAVNQGWYLRARKSTGVNSIFASNQADLNADAGNNIAYRPMLVISYIPGIATPTPVVTPTPTPSPTPPPPELPREYLDTTYSLPAGGQVIQVHDGGDLQAAIDQANYGDVIELQAGATFTGHFNLPEKLSNVIPLNDSEILENDWIYITSSAYSSLPAPGTRVSPSDADNMPEIITEDSMAAINVSMRANHYRFVGIEIATTYDSLDSMNYNVIDLSIQSGLTQVSELANNITFDRCYIHGTPAGNVKRGITANCASFAIIDSYMSEFHTVGYDNQAIGVFNGPGPFKIVNNFLSAACENVMFGGADATDETFQPADIEIRGNYFYKPMSWRIDDPSYAGIPWSVKNIFELKNAKRVLFDGNILENHWAHAQAGPSFLLTPRNQDGTNPWAGVEDVTITNNIIRHVAAGFNILGSDDGHPSKMTNNILIKNNIMEGIVGAELGGSGTAFQLGGGMDLVTIDHNTISSNTGGIMAVEAPQESITNFKFINNIISHNTNGVYGTGRPMGNGTINYFFLNPLFTKNVMAGGSDIKYPAGNFFPTSMNEVGFVNYNEGVSGDYHLGAGSIYKNAGTDGNDAGADISAVEYATSGVLSGISPVATATPEPTPTATPELTPTPTPELTPTATPIPTATPMPTATVTATPTPTVTTSATPTVTTTATPTVTPIQTPGFLTPTPTATAIPTPTVTATATPTPTDTTTATATPSLTPTVTSTETANPTPVPTFTDLAGFEWAEVYINSLAAAGVIGGYPDGTFGPGNNITRAEFAKMLTVAFGVYDASATSSFTDVLAEAWYYSYVGSLEKEALTVGNGDGTFSPESDMTREEMFAFNARAMNKYYFETILTNDAEETATILAGFVDGNLVSDWARGYVATNVKLEIVQGSPVEGGMALNPRNSIIRAEVAVVLDKTAFN